MQRKFENNLLLAPNLDRSSGLQIFWVGQHGLQRETKTNFNKSGAATQVMDELSIMLVHFRIREMIESSTRWWLLHYVGCSEPTDGICRSHSLIGNMTVYTKDMRTES
jgi:hypothetical protein